VICSTEAGFLQNRFTNSYSTLQEYDSGYAAFVLAKQASLLSRYSAEELTLVRHYKASMSESDSGRAAFLLLKLDSQASASTSQSQTAFSPDAGFMALYQPYTVQAAGICSVVKAN